MICFVQILSYDQLNNKLNMLTLCLKYIID